jgi:hypothetical protein
MDCTIFWFTIGSGSPSTRGNPRSISVSKLVHSKGLKLPLGKEMANTGFAVEVCAWSVMCQSTLTAYEPSWHQQLARNLLSSGRKYFYTLKAPWIQFSKEILTSGEGFDRMVNVLIVAPESLPTLVDGTLRDVRDEVLRWWWKFWFSSWSWFLPLLSCEEVKIVRSVLPHSPIFDEMELWPPQSRSWKDSQSYMTPALGRVASSKSTVVFTLTNFSLPHFPLWRNVEVIALSTSLVHRLALSMNWLVVSSSRWLTEENERREWTLRGECSLALQFLWRENSEIESDSPSLT